MVNVVDDNAVTITNTKVSYINENQRFLLLPDYQRRRVYARFMLMNEAGTLCLYVGTYPIFKFAITTGVLR